jgi:hypothetical protein
MSDSSSTQSRSPKKPKTKHRVRAALRTATNRPPRSCAHCLDLIAEYADQETGRNAFMSVGTLMKRLRRGERQTRAMMVRLRAGGWIAEQTEGPDPHAIEAYHRLYPDPRHRPPVYRMVLPTLSCPRGAESAPLTLVIKGCGNRHGRGAETDTEGVRLPAGIPSILTSESSALRSKTDSIQSLSEKPTPPHRAGGSVSGTSDSVSSLAPDLDPTPTEREIYRTVLAALKLLQMPTAVFTTKAGNAQIAALKTITADGECCLECALLVPFWVMHGSVGHGTGENLQGMNARTSLAYLWGNAWGDLMGRATMDAGPDRGDGHLDRAEFDAWIADLDLYDADRWEDGAEISDAIRTACRWCPKQRTPNRVRRD